MNIKIFDLNCWLLPPPISIRNMQRLNDIISLIKRIKPDIISLQEVWLNKYANKIERELAEYTFIRYRHGLFNKSGLMTGISIKHKSHEIHFFPMHKEYGLSEKIARKGYHIIQLSDNLLFINTHLYAAITDYQNLITKAQFESLQKATSSKRCIIAGDLNLDKKDLKKVNHKYDFTSHDITISKSNPYTNYLSRKHYYMEVKIDYILKSKNTGISLSTKCLRKPIVSDHFALIGRVKI